jgi:hypothetical protein
MNLDFAIKSQEDLEEYLIGIFTSFFDFNDRQTATSIKKVNHFLSGIKARTSICIEYPYIDKLYRDSYYHYYSSKLNRYGRDCIRLSFFNGDISIYDFHSEKGLKTLQEAFMGFLVLKPLLRIMLQQQKQVPL